MDFASREILPLVNDMPIIFGINATDPTDPTVGLIDGNFNKDLEDIWTT